MERASVQGTPAGSIPPGRTLHINPKRENLKTPRGRLVVSIAIAAILGSLVEASQTPGLPFLLIWPTPRMTALAGTAAGQAPDAGLTYWNPGASGLAESFSFEIAGGEWLPGLYEGMGYLFAAGNYAGVKLASSRVGIGAHSANLWLGETDVVNEHGEFIGRYSTWRGSFGMHSGISLLQDKLGLGLGVKYVASYLTPSWWADMPGLGIDIGGTGGTVAVDLGVLHRPLAALSWGLAVSNLGPDITYESTGESKPLPRMLRLGASWAPVRAAPISLRLSAQADKVLVGMFDDPSGNKTFARLLREEARGIWKGIGLEATFFDILTARVGYFEDLDWQRGGIIFEKDGTSRHHGLTDLILRRDLGNFRSLGLTWGVGVGWRDYLRLEFCNDAAIYDFPTANWRLGLVVNNAAGLGRELGRVFDVRPSWRPPLPVGEYAPAPREMVYTGSGVLLSDSGLFATCYHVLEKAVSIEVYFPDRDTFFPARILSRDVSNDLAILQLDIPKGLSLPPVAFALQEPGDARLGMATFTLGYPFTDILGRSPRYSAGSVSAMTGIADDAARLQIQNPIQSGNSGGPLFSEDGKMAGVVVSSLSYKYMLRYKDDLPENVNFAVKIGHMRNLLAEIPEGRNVLARPHGLAIGKPEDVVEQLRTHIGLVRVRAVE